ncbi:MULTISPECIES: DUF3598 family protein [unclassified Moorena]|uniref:DUF3598 family protein n=1 Tax=unclassified Moorena TaxID=2683338 RepID=UPI0014017BDF|nr:MULTISPECIES: DUF3598 family protein [unclassified Moorena]NEO11477.1 hypothetical protein [Moorena sp. SIO3E8]NEP97937.1 hypothetical protein [Moorena sp. SIO3F7]
MSDLLTQNWEKFLEIQAIGDWNGIWTRLAGNGELVERCLDAVAHGGNPQDRAASLSWSQELCSLS